MSNIKHHSKPLSHSDCIVQYKRKNVAKKDEDQITNMYKSVIIEDDYESEESKIIANMYKSVVIEEDDDDELFSKKVKSNLGESYYVCKKINMDELRKSEYDAIKEQDNYAKYKKTKKYLKKGGQVFATSNTAIGAFFTFLTVSKYVLAFL